MEKVILIVHLVLALSLIGVVLLQRSEGGLGGLGGGGGAISARGAANALSRMTWIFAIAFFCTSLLLTIIAAQNSAGGSVVERLGVPAPAPVEAPALPSGGDLLPPPAGDATTTPPRAD